MKIPKLPPKVMKHLRSMLPPEPVRFMTLPRFRECPRCDRKWRPMGLHIVKRDPILKEKICPPCNREEFRSVGAKRKFLAYRIQVKP
jgi:hypothetical protein